MNLKTSLQAPPLPPVLLCLIQASPVIHTTKKMYFTGKMWERPLLGFIGWWTEHMNEYYCPDCGRTFDIQEDVYDRKVGELYY